MIARLVVCAIVAALLSGGQALAKGGSLRSEDRYNPQHIENLPAEVRGAVMRQCAIPRALHEFAAYSDHQRIVLHYEHFYCEGRDIFCNACGCLHQVYELSGGHYRLLRSYYAPN
jgi:hypothetical protein